MTIPTPHPDQDPAHDCDNEFSPYCVDDCADPCECGCNDEPDAENGIMVVERDGTERAATNKEAALWARHMVKAGILPKDHSMVVAVRSLRRRELTRAVITITAATIIAAAFLAAFSSPTLTDTEKGVLLFATGAAWVIWRACRK